MHPQRLDRDLAPEHEARALYLEAARYCDQVNDRVSKEMFEGIAGDEEAHIDFLETQLTQSSRSACSSTRRSTSESSARAARRECSPRG